MKALIVVAMAAAVAVAGLDVGLGTGLQQRVGDGTRLPLVGQIRAEVSALGLPLEARALGMTWAENHTSTGRVQYLQAGFGTGWRFSGVSVFAGAGLARYSGSLEDGELATWLAFRMPLNETQMTELLINSSGVEDKPIGVLAVCSWRL